MDFDKVEREHILQGIKDFEERGIPPGFKNSTTYNLIFEGKEYPPKVIMVYANYHASGRKIEWYFKGGEGTECFEVLKKEGFTIEKKDKSIKNLKAEFINWLDATMPPDSGAKTSYIRAIELLEEPLGYNVFSIADVKILEKLYKDLIKEQRNEKGIYYNPKLSSYGQKGFYSAAIKRYLQFIKEIKGLVVQPEFFKQEEFDLLEKMKGKSYNKANPKMVEAYEKLQSSYAKVKYWAEQVQSELFPEGISKIRMRPTNRTNNFESYQWARIYPDREKEKNKWLAFTVGIETNGGFNIKFDTYKVDEKGEKRLAYLRLNNNYENPEIVKKISYKSSDVRDWDGLIKATISFYKELETRYNNFFNKFEHDFAMEPTSINYKPSDPLNIILYGPPGTGKTFKLQNEYFARFTIKESNLSKEQYLVNLIKNLKWWQIIAIAVYDLNIAATNDIMNHPLIQARISTSSAENIRALLWSNLQTHTVIDCEHVKTAQRIEPLVFSKDENSRWSVRADDLKELFPEFESILNESKNFSRKEDKLIQNYEFVTFHQSFSYEDFVEGIKPKLEEEDNDEISYEIKDGVFKTLSLKAKADPDKDYAIFIDEINRGNVAAIFGELITLIEKDKRLGGDYPLTVKLPYSKKEFGVPSNLYIFGTMNTADRSVEALDTALRRRFTFKELMPDPSLLYDKLFHGFTLKEVLQTINERIEVLVDRDHTIGHSYFLSVDAGDTKALALVFQNRIIPLLQEYFYHDYEKIALILGEGFVEPNKQNVTFPSFKEIDIPETQTRYQLRTDISDIEKEVRILLNKDEQEQ